jgi:hypothetical protein
MKKERSGIGTTARVAMVVTIVVVAVGAVAAVILLNLGAPTTPSGTTTTTPQTRTPTTTTAPPPSAPYTVETSVTDHDGTTCIQVTVHGKKEWLTQGWLTLYLSDPSRNTVDQAYIFEGDMADGAETKWLALMGVGGYKTTAEPGTYTLRILDLYGNVVYGEEFTFTGARVSVVSCDPVFETYYGIGCYLDKLTITARNDGDLPAYISGVHVSIDDKEGSGFADATGLSGEIFTVEADYFSMGPFSEGAYTLTLRMETGLLGGEVLTTYTTTIEVPSSTTPTPSSTTPAPPEIVLVSYTSSPVSSALDQLYFGYVDVTLKNNGNASVEIYKLILTVGGEEYTARYLRDFWEANLDPHEKADFTIYCGSIDREIGVYSFTGNLEVQDSNSRTLLKQDLAFTIPTIGMGDTLPEVEGTDNISLTFLRWIESDIAVDGPYFENEYYTFTAKPGMKFVILIYEFQNNGIRPQETPYISAGEIATEEGYIYPAWNPPLGVHSEEYQPREATDNEIETLIGDSGGYVDLLPGAPGESVVGCVVFEIPEGATPVEADLECIDPLVRF